MSEIIERDNYALLLRQLQNTIHWQSETANVKIVQDWIEQRATIWEGLQRQQDAVTPRAGSSEDKAQAKIYEDHAAINDAINVSLSHLLTLKTTNAHPVVNKNEIIQSTTLRILKKVAAYIKVNVGSMVPGEMECHRSDLNRLNIQLQEIRLERIVSGEDETTVNEDEADAIETYMQALHVLGTILPVSVPAPIAPVAPANTAEAIKIPTMEIAPFDGRFEMWETFRESFHQSVHMQATLPAPLKLQYLQSLLKGEPKELLRSCDKYESAWDMLNDRYNNVRELVFSHLRSITSQRKCNESVEDIRRLMDCTTNAVLALSNLGRPTKTWGDWIVLHVMDKLDDESLRMWKQKIGDNEDVPTWPQMEEFLKGRSCSLIAIGEQATTNVAINDTKNVQTYQSSEPRNSESGKSTWSSDGSRLCSVCSGQHLIQCCDEFRNMTVSERRGMIAAKKLCFVCMSAGHHAVVCRSNQSCQTCKQRHNTMLHFSNFKQQQTNSEQSVVATAANASNDYNKRPQVILATALVNVQGSDGRFY